MTSNNPNGVDTKYQYDELNRIVGVNGTKYSYDEVGNLTNNELPNGVKTTYTYNNVNRLKEMNSGVASYSYTLNSIGNRIKVRENGVRDVVYKYDEVNRLTEEKVIGVGAISYSYDDVGNRQTRTSTVPGISTTTYSYNRARYLNTETGRFQSRDSFEGIIYSPNTLHKYLHVGNDPLNKIDPSGNFGFSIGGLSIGINLSNVITGISVISIASTCAVQYQLSTSGADSGLIKGPCSARRDGLNQMRVQLQQDDNHLASQVVSAPSNPGVSVEQLRRALELLFFNGRDSIPNRLESAFLGAIARSSIQYGKYPPGGVSRGDNFWREEFYDRGKEYRVDSENRSGTNLRVFY